MRAAGILLAIILAAACSSPTASSNSAASVEPTTTLVPSVASLSPDPTPRRDLTGRLAVKAASFMRNTQGNFLCAPDTGFRVDIGDGTQVVVEDETGTIIGTGALVSSTDIFDRGYDRSTNKCSYFFKVGSLPVAKFYRVTIGSREPLVYTSEQLDSTNWSLELSLG